MGDWFFYQLAILTFILLIYLGWRLSRASHSVTGAAGMLGRQGQAETDLSPEGKVFVHGELWRARAALPIPAGERVRVVHIDGLTLEVEPCDLRGRALRSVVEADSE